MPGEHDAPSLLPAKAVAPVRSSVVLEPYAKYWFSVMRTTSLVSLRRKPSVPSANVHAALYPYAELPGNGIVATSAPVPVPSWTRVSTSPSRPHRYPCANVQSVGVNVCVRLRVATTDRVATSMPYATVAAGSFETTQ